MAESLIESMSGAVAPEQYPAANREARQPVLDAQVAGREVVAALKIPELRAKAKNAPEPDERLSAQRILNTLGVQTSFYLPQSFSEHKEYDRAVFVLSIAAEIAPEDPSVWYSRAQAYARKGDRKRALADLQQSVDKGWKSLATLQQDEAFAPLRQDPEYQRLTAALAGNAKQPTGGSR